MKTTPYPAGTRIVPMEFRGGRRDVPPPPVLHAVVIPFLAGEEEPCGTRPDGPAACSAPAAVWVFLADEHERQQRPTVPECADCAREYLEWPNVETQQPDTCIPCYVVASGTEAPR